jgi:hypothetical protein
VPISQKRMSAIERELAVIVRELDRIERARVKRPEQPPAQFPGHRRCCWIWISRAARGPSRLPVCRPSANRTASIAGVSIIAPCMSARSQKLSATPARKAGHGDASFFCRQRSRRAPQVWRLRSRRPGRHGARSIRAAGEALAWSTFSGSAQGGQVR